MPHATPLISLLTIGLGFAFVFGMIATRLKLSPLVGYLVAGVVIGPFTPGFVGDPHLAGELAEIGVILLMFGVGLHFSLKDLLSVRAIAIPGALAQIGAATLLGLGMGTLMGWTVEAGIVFGLALSVASTVVLLRALQERRVVQTDKGRIAVGWLIVEDLAMVLALVLLPTWAGIREQMAEAGGFTWAQAQEITIAVLLTLGKVGAFIVIMLVIGKRAIPWLLHRVLHLGSRELFRLSVLAIALGVALGASELFGVSFALGAFFAGMIMGESELSHQAANETLPLRDAFAVLFFVSVGMLFDPLTLVNNPWPLLGALAIVVVGKSLAALLIMGAFKQKRENSALIAASLAQIGEFSFILAGLGVGLGLLPEEARDLILGAAILSIVLNPLVFLVADRFTPKAAPVEAEPVRAGSPGRAIIVGYGRVGSRLGKALGAARVDYSVIEDRQELVEKLHEQGLPAVAGNGVSIETLKAAAVESAQLIYITVPDGFEAGRIVEIARQLNPGIRIFARSHNDAEIDHLRSFGADVIISGEEEIAQAMIDATGLAKPVGSAV
ncbi:MAG: Kef family K(+) transporter [Hyphomonadaceae bacterium]|nr:Kef family K(+) transporter [Hyphomonadaceae bacterium]MBP9233281.1 Kef family K(+) transporter [Hyphomonadaceae bacterium]